MCRAVCGILNTHNADSSVLVTVRLCCNLQCCHISSFTHDILFLSSRIRELYACVIVIIASPHFSYFSCNF